MGRKATLVRGFRANVKRLGLPGHPKVQIYTVIYDLEPLDVSGRGTAITHSRRICVYEDDRRAFSGVLGQEVVRS